jgi:hypothetical protein
MTWWQFVVVVVLAPVAVPWYIRYCLWAMGVRDRR